MKLDPVRLEQMFNDRLILRDMPATECYWVDQRISRMRYSELYDMLKRYEKYKKTLKKEV